MVYPFFASVFCFPTLLLALTPTGLDLALEADPVGGVGATRHQIGLAGPGRVRHDRRAGLMSHRRRRVLMKTFADASPNKQHENSH